MLTEAFLPAETFPAWWSIGDLKIFVIPLNPFVKRFSAIYVAFRVALIFCVAFFKKSLPYCLN